MPPMEAPSSVATMQSSLIAMPPGFLHQPRNIVEDLSNVDSQVEARIVDIFE